jgi:hypothetical protein
MEKKERMFPIISLWGDANQKVIEILLTVIKHKEKITNAGEAVKKNGTILTIGWNIN